MKFFGQNTPKEKIDEMAKYVRQIEEEAEKIAAAAPCKTKEEYNAAGVVGRNITTLSKEVEAARNDDKRPFIDAGNAVDAAYGVPRNPAPESLQARLKAAKDSVLAAAEPYARKLREAEEERQRKLREQAAAEAEAARQKQAEADRLLAEARTKEAAEEWRAAEMEAKNRAALAEKTEAQAMKAKPISAGITGNKMRYITRRSAEVVNWEEAIAAYSNHPKLLAIVQELANADARSGVAVSGVVIHEEKILQSA